MSTPPETIRGWLEDAHEHGALFLLVVCDTFDHCDFPVEVAGEDAQRMIDWHNSQPMQRVMECYDLALDWETQLAAPRAWNARKAPPEVPDAHQVAPAPVGPTTAPTEDHGGRLGEIRARLGKATPGIPILSEDDIANAAYADCAACVAKDYDECVHVDAKAVTAFFANAPADLAYLLGEVARLEAQNSAAGVLRASLEARLAATEQALAESRADRHALANRVQGAEGLLWELAALDESIPLVDVLRDSGDPGWAEVARVLLQAARDLLARGQKADPGRAGDPGVVGSSGGGSGEIPAAAPGDSNNTNTTTQE